MNIFRFGKRSGADLLENSINSLLKKTQANGENQPETEVDESITQYDFDGNITLSYEY